MTPYSVVLPQNNTKMRGTFVAWIIALCGFFLASRLMLYAFELPLEKILKLEAPRSTLLQFAIFGFLVQLLVFCAKKLNTPRIRYARIYKASTVFTLACCILVFIQFALISGRSLFVRLPNGFVSEGMMKFQFGLLWFSVVICITYIAVLAWIGRHNLEDPELKYSLVPASGEEPGSPACHWSPEDLPA